MFILITGLPGNGKTLFALKHIHERATKEERKVYYNGINLTDKGKEVLDWEHFEDPKRWFDFPPGAIVVLDEAQYLFEKRKSGERVPEFVAKVATHRHGGLDVYLITQRPSLIDPYVRDLVEKHYHVKRMFGGQRAMISEFSPASPNLSRADFKDAVQRPWPYPKEVYSWYVSAELHTHKLDLPWRKLAWGGGALLVGLAAMGMFAGRMAALMDRDKGGGEAKGQQQGGAGGGAQGGPSGPGGPRAARPEDWFDARRARIAGLPHTAPVYDGVTAPQDAPKPAACIQSARQAARCTCYTQQGTVIVGMRLDICQQIVRYGWFDDSHKGGGLQPNGPAPATSAGQSQQLASADQRRVPQQPDGAPLPRDLGKGPLGWAVY